MSENCAGCKAYDVETGLRNGVESTRILKKKVQVLSCALYGKYEREILLIANEILTFKIESKTQLIKH